MKNFVLALSLLVTAAAFAADDPCKTGTLISPREIQVSRDVSFASQAFGQNHQDQSVFKISRQPKGGAATVVDTREMNSSEGDAFEAAIYRSLYTATLNGKLVRMKWDLWQHQILEATDCADPIAPTPCDSPKGTANPAKAAH